MEYSEAQQSMVENLSRQPQEFERQLETIFLNPAFGNVITEVYPEVTDPHNRDGRMLLKKYAEVAHFLEETRDVDDAIFLALRLESERSLFDGNASFKNIKALSVRYYQGLRAEHFGIASSEQGEPLGVSIEHPSLTLTTGWNGESLTQSVTPYGVVDATMGLQVWSSTPTDEQQTPARFIMGKNINEVDFKISKYEFSQGLKFRPVGRFVNDMQIELFRVNAGLEPKAYPVA